MPLYVIGNKTVFFVHVPKTGGASVERFLAANGKEFLKSKTTPPGFPCPLQHLPADLIEQIAPACDLTFCVVRNPYDRLISEYLFRFAERSKPLPHFDVWWSFSKAMYRRNQYFLSNHIAPQISYVSDNTLVYRFEDGIESILTDVADVVGIPAPRSVPHEKRSPKVELQISPKTLKSIAEFYAEDFNAFGYSTDPRQVIDRRGIKQGGGSPIRWLFSSQGINYVIKGAAYAFRA